MLDFEEEFNEPPRRYDDDGLEFYTTNADYNDNLSEAEKIEVIRNQRMVDASTFDLMSELDRRFNHIIIVGKRLISVEPEGSDGDAHRNTEVITDNRFMLRGDVHTMYGLAHEIKEHIHYCMEMGEDKVELGFGPVEYDMEEEEEDDDDD